MKVYSEDERTAPIHELARILVQHELFDKFVGEKMKPGV
jgi:hypothetical protein